MNAAVGIEMCRPVALFIYYANNPQWFITGISELVGHHGRHVNRVVRLDGEKLVAQPNIADSGKHHHAMLMAMLFEAGVTAHFDLETAHLKSRFGFGHQVLAGDELPVAGVVLIDLCFQAVPVLSVPLADQSNTTIALRISPFFIA